MTRLLNILLTLSICSSILGAFLKYIAPAITKYLMGVAGIKIYAFLFFISITLRDDGRDLQDFSSVIAIAAAVLWLVIRIIRKNRGVTH
jgi:hypothetical protein